MFLNLIKKCNEKNIRREIVRDDIMSTVICMRLSLDRKRSTSHSLARPLTLLLVSIPRRTRTRFVRENSAKLLSRRPAGNAKNTDEVHRPYTITASTVRCTFTTRTQPSPSSSSLARDSLVSCRVSCERWAQTGFASYRTSMPLVRGRLMPETFEAVKLFNDRYLLSLRLICLFYNY